MDGEAIDIGCDSGFSQVTAEEGMRLLAAFRRIDDPRQRAWMIAAAENLARVPPRTSPRTVQSAARSLFILEK